MRSLTVSLLPVLLLWVWLLPGTSSQEVKFRLHKSRTESAIAAGETPLDDLFAHNHRVRFSWDDPELNRRLWAGLEEAGSSKRAEKRSALGKRAPGDRIVLPPVLRSRHCLGCVKTASGQKATIDDFSTEWLETQLLKTDAQLKNKCLFYTGVTVSEHPPWIPEGGNLSPHASQFACQNGLYTIWNLFPGRSGNEAPVTEPDSPSRYNFWEIFHEGSWINAIVNDRFTYFENMSEAMARHCTGKVWVVSLRPRETTTYGTGTDDDNNAHSIWNKKELPALRAHGGVTELIGVQATGPNGQVGEMWRLDINDPNLEAIGEYTGPIPRDLESFFGKRDTCSSNQAYEPLGEDWFGTGSMVY
ncbi:hypothetical protein DL768_010419 [Monosporascus sp. mg162]|nr:hypothetical protein DL768_010419 [Monosporascus sp. mg162]